MTPAIKSATLHGTLRIPYAEQGDPGGLSVLLLHGYSDSLHSFDLMLPHLPRDLHVIAPSQRGHGDAGRPAGGYGPDGHAADAIALLDALGVEQAVVVGHSMGSQTALRLALDYPGRVLGVALLGGFSTLGSNPVVAELWDAVATLSDPVDPGFVEEFQRSTVARPIPDAFLDRVVRESLKLPARVWRAALRGQLDADLMRELGRVLAPTLILWGDQDAIIPRIMQETLRNAIPRSRMQVLPGTGHAPHWEEPERVAATIRDFAQEVGMRHRWMVSLAAA